MIDYKVSICCITFNHVNFISKAIDSFLMQITDFPFEVLVYDDASTDGTSEIINMYQKKFPSLVFPIIQEQNQWSRGVRGMNMRYNFPRARGKYIAMCEGDDFWTDPLKLQKQVDFLEHNPGLAGCFHNSITVDKDGMILSNQYFQSNQQIFTQLDCLTTLQSSYATCSLMFRNLVEFPENLMNIQSDFTMDLLITKKGNLGYMPENMSAYRIHNSGIWQGTSHLNNDLTVLKRYETLLSDIYFHEKYSDILVNKIIELKESICNGYRFQTITCPTDSWFENIKQMSNYSNDNILVKIYYILRFGFISRIKYKLTATLKRHNRFYLSV